MDTSRRQSAIAWPGWVSKLVGVLCFITVVQIIVQEIVAVHSNNKTSSIISATSFFHHGKASTSADLGWYPPNATLINNLTHVLEAKEVYGFVYNNSYPSHVLYSGYNSCNMPHVRKQEYKKPSDEYKLIYVEIVSLRST